MLGHFSMLFRIFVTFWTHLAPSCDFLAFFYDFLRFFVDLGWILGRFFDDFWGFFVDLGWILGRFLDGFSRIVGISRKNCDFVKTLKKPRFLQCFVKVDLLKNNKKSTKYL